eukprot:scaffold10887_cov109-Isochrysis_galbana.AAC.5
MEGTIRTFETRPTCGIHHATCGPVGHTPVAAKRPAGAATSRAALGLETGQDSPAHLAPRSIDVRDGVRRPCLSEHDRIFRVVDGIVQAGGSPVALDPGQLRRRHAGQRTHADRRGRRFLLLLFHLGRERLGRAKLILPALQRRNHSMRHGLTLQDAAKVGDAAVQVAQRVHPQRVVEGLARFSLRAGVNGMGGRGEGEQASGQGREVLLG